MSGEHRVVSIVSEQKLEDMGTLHILLSTSSS